MWSLHGAIIPQPGWQDAGTAAVRFENGSLQSRMPALILQALGSDGPLWPVASATLMCMCASSRYQDTLVHEVLDRSEAKTWGRAVLEWEIAACEEDPH